MEEGANSRTHTRPFVHLSNCRPVTGATLLFTLTRKKYVIGEHWSSVRLGRSGCRWSTAKNNNQHSKIKVTLVFLLSIRSKGPSSEHMRDATMEETLKREQSRQLPREVLPPQSNRVLAVSGSSVMTHPLLIQLLSSLVTFFKLILLLNFYYFMNRKKSQVARTSRRVFCLLLMLSVAQLPVQTASDLMVHLKTPAKRACSGFCVHTDAGLLSLRNPSKSHVLLSEQIPHPPTPCG